MKKFTKKLKNYERRMFQFLHKYKFVSAEWRDDSLWLFDANNEECNTYQCSLHIQHELRELEDMLRQRNIQPFALDTAEGGMNK